MERPVTLQRSQLIPPSKESLFFIRWSSSFPPSIFGKWQHGSLHHRQVFERVAALLLGFISWSQEFNLPLLGFDFVLVLLQFLLGCDVWVSDRLGGQNEGREVTADKTADALGAAASFLPVWPCGVCVLLASAKTLSGQRRMRERTSPVPLASSAVRSAPVPGSSAWDLNRNMEA